jgi:uncharacterized membrane protein
MYRISVSSKGSVGRYMSQFVVAIVSDQAGVDNVNRVLEKLGRDGTTIYRSAVLYKNSDGRISTTHRVAERSKAVVTAAAFIGALAGFPAGLEAALAGAMGGALFGISAEMTNRDVGNRIIRRVSHDLARNKFAIFVEMSSTGVVLFEACMKKCDATILHLTGA